MGWSLERTTRAGSLSGEASERRRPLAILAKAPVSMIQGRMKTAGEILQIVLSKSLGTVCTMVIIGGGLSEAAGPTMARISLSNDGQFFVRDGRKGKFVPWGFNYLGEHGRLAEDDWDTAEGWTRIQEDFRRMSALGANVVRWHLQFATFMTGPRSPSPENLKRLEKLLTLARESGLYLKLTGLNCFRQERVPEWYEALEESARWDAQAVFWSAIARTCAGAPEVFCYDLMNEPVIGGGGDEESWLTGKLGGFHFVQRISRDPGQRAREEVAAQWIAKMKQAIRRFDQKTLVTVGVIPWAFVWPKAQPVFYAPSGARHLDFVSLHVYPEKGKLKEELAALTTYEIGKPLVIGEIFPLKCSLPEMDAFIDASASQVDGWMSHYFGHTVQEHRAGAGPGPGVAAILQHWSEKGATVIRKKDPESQVSEKPRNR